MIEEKESFSKDELEQEPRTQNKVKKFTPRPLSQADQHKLNQKKIREEKYLSEDTKIKEVNKEEAEQQFEEMFHDKPYSQKIVVNHDSGKEFVYKIIYQNGQGYKAQKGMAIKMKFRTTLLDGHLVHNNIYVTTMSQLIGEGRMNQFFETIAMSVCKGEVGTMIITPKYAFGALGLFPDIPPNSTLRVDYWILDLRQKQAWEINQVQKYNQIESDFKEIQSYLSSVKKSHQSMGIEQSREKSLYYLYRTRLAEERLKFTYTPQVDTYWKKVCANQIFLVALLGQKLYALELVEKYFQLQGGNLGEEYLIGFQQGVDQKVFNIKIEIEFNFGMHKQIRQDLKLIKQKYLNFSKKRFQQIISNAQNHLDQYENLSLEKKQELALEYKFKIQYCIQKEKELSQTELYLHDPIGYRPFAPQNTVPQVSLTQKDHPDIVKWLIGSENLPYYLNQIKEGWEKKIDWDREKKYNEDYRKWKNKEQGRREECAKKKQRFEPGFWVQKRDKQSWQEYDLRRREQELSNRMFKVHREHGERFLDYEVRKNKTEEEIQKKKQGERIESKALSKVHNKLKAGFKDGKFPKMSRDEAYRCFQIE